MSSGCSRPRVSCADAGCGDGTYCDAESGLCASEFVIPDPSLDSCVRLYLNKREGVLTVDDAAELTYLSCTDYGIADLTGLEHFANLTHLSLWENEITAVSWARSLSRGR